MPESLQEYTVEATGAAWSRLEDEVNPPLGLQRERVDSDSQAFLEAEETTIRTGIVQGLMDLGYLPEKDLEFSVDAIQSALSQWREDTLAWPASYRLTTGEGSLEQVGNDALDLNYPFPVLTAQTSFDGDVQFGAMPSLNGDVSIASRILQFRLRALNRCNDPVGSRLAASTHSTVAKLRGHFLTQAQPSITELDFLNRLGDAAYLTRQFGKRYRKQIFVTKYKAQSEAAPSKRAHDYAVLQYKTLPEKKKKARTRKRIKHTNYLLSHAKGSRRSTSLSQRFKEDVNALALELLQLRLWQHGFYTGTLDADWGKKSDEALKDFHKTFREEEDEKSIRMYPRADFIAPVVGGQVINICFIFEQLFNDADRTIKATSNKHLAQTVEHVFPDEDQTEEWTKIDQHAQRFNKDLENAPAQVSVKTFRNGKSESNHRRRRKNFSRNGILGSVSGWFRRIGKKIKTGFQKVAEHIREAIVAGLDSIQNFFRFAISKVKRVIRVVKVALQRFYYWIASKPFGSGDADTGQFMMTRWSIDFDTVNVASSNAPASLLQYHMGRIAFMNASFEFVVKVALEVLGLIIDFAKLGGIGLAYSIYKSIRNWTKWKENNPFLLYLEPTYQH